MRGGEGAHVQHGADRRSPAPHAAVAPAGAAVAGEGRDANEGGDLFVGEVTELG